MAAGVAADLFHLDGECGTAIFQPDFAIGLVDLQSVNVEVFSSQGNFHDAIRGGDVQVEVAIGLLKGADDMEFFSFLEDGYPAIGSIGNLIDDGHGFAVVDCTDKTKGLRQKSNSVQRWQINIYVKSNF